VWHVKGAVTTRLGTKKGKGIKFTLEETMKAQRGCRGIAILFL
jgi:hypothetical protein